MGLDFKNRGSSSAGKFSYREAKEKIQELYGSLNLTYKARDYFIKGLDKGGEISGKEFNDLINDAVEMDLIDKFKAEKMKDIVNLPDNYNKHWN